MSLLVFGRSGQVAIELGRAGQGMPPPLRGPLILLGRDEADLADPDACAAAIRAHAPSAVINAAAYTAVDRAESDEALATTINGAAPAAMARACAGLDIPFVHISTDYVFAGTGSTPAQPGDRTAPANAYGRSKRTGEQGVLAAGGRCAILRTSWVFSAQGNNFVRTMLRLSDSRSELSVVADQIGGPTPARAIAAACLSMAAQLLEAPEKAGVYHFSGAPDASWADFAREIFAQAGREVRVTDIPSSAYPTPAQRPLNSRLDCQSTGTTFGLLRPDWRQELSAVLSQLEIRS